MAFRHLLDKRGYVDLYGASRHALRFFAIQAATGFGHGLLLIISQAHLIKIVTADLGGLLTHGHTTRRRDGERGLLYSGIHTLAMVLRLLSAVNMVVHSLTAHTFVKINQGSIEFGAVHAGKAGLPANRHAACATHARAVHHQGVQAHNAGNIELCCLLCNELHHNHRADGRNLIVTFPFFFHQTRQHIRHGAFLPHRTIVGGDVEIVGNGTQFLNVKQQRFGASTDNHITIKTMRIHPFHQRVDGCNAHAACDEAVARATQLTYGPMDEGRGPPQRTDNVVVGLAHLEIQHLAGGIAYRLHHQGDRAVKEVRVADGQRDTFGLLVRLHNDELARQRRLRNLGGFHFQ